MKRLLPLFALVTLVSTASGSEYDETHRRPIDYILLNQIADHTYTLKWCTGGTCTPDSSWSCGESFGGGCDCASYSTSGSYPQNCSIDDGGWEAYGQLWGYQCASWLGGRSYGSWGVCHQATANMTWYVKNSAGNLPNDVRGWGASVAAFGTWGTDGGAGCY